MVFALSASFMVVQVVVGWWTNSLALLADAAHLFVDAAGVGFSLLAVWFAERPATAEKTYGYYRVEILAALVNGVVLCLLAIVILVEAWERLRVPHEVSAGPVLVVAVAGLGVNLLAAWLLHAGAAESLNVRGAYLEVLGDALSSAAVIVAAAVILVTGWTPADALASAAIGLLILPRTFALLRQAVNVLLEGVPAHLDLAEIEAALRSTDGSQAGARSPRLDAHLRARGHERPRRGGSGNTAGPDPGRAPRGAPRPLRHRPHDHPGRNRVPAPPADHPSKLGRFFMRFRTTVSALASPPSSPPARRCGSARTTTSRATRRRTR